MGLISSDDLAQMRSDISAVMGDRKEEITIRRGATSLLPQSVRIALAGRGRRAESTGGEESRARVIVVGGIDLDVQPGDRFNDSNGVLYRVVLVRPNRTAMTVAEAEIIE